MGGATQPLCTTPLDSHVLRLLPLQVRDFLSRKDIKPDSSLGERLLQYFEFTVEGGESGGDAAVTEQLPNSLLSEVILHENYALIHKVHLFNGVSQGFVNSLVLKMKPELCLPGDRNAASHLRGRSAPLSPPPSPPLPSNASCLHHLRLHQATTSSARERSAPQCTSCSKARCR